MKQGRIYALGFFDGVHLGHQALLRACADLARDTGSVSAAITFDRHPRSLFSPEQEPLLSTLQDRQQLLQDYGMEEVLLLEVTPEQMATPWDVFLNKLADRDAAGFVCGDDFRFGHRGEGDRDRLAAFCRDRGLECRILPEQTLEGIRVSSSYIRRQIESGDMATAVKFLGHPYRLTGRVVPGQQLGRRLGIPTANLVLPENLAVPKFGVYACRVRIDGKDRLAVTNIGRRPTVQGAGITVEPWILDYAGDLYGRELTLEFYRFLRPEVKFPDLEALKREIRADAAETRRYFLGGEPE